MAEMTGGQALAKSLYREGVRVIFGLPGAQLYYATDALFDEPGIRWISTRNEQATTFMADGYARAGGGIGTAMVVPGPGVLNATSGLSTAYSASSPVLLVAGQVPRDLIGVNRGMLHEIDDQLEAVKSVTKWAARVLQTDRRPPPRCTRLSGSSTPAALGPWRLRSRRTPWARRRMWSSWSPPSMLAKAPPESQIAEAARLIAESDGKVVIWAGGGADSEAASAALTSLAEYIQAPGPCRRERAREPSQTATTCPLARLAGGKRPYSGSSPTIPSCWQWARVWLTANLPEGHRVVQIDIDPEEIGRNYKDSTMPVLGDAAVSLEWLHGAVSGLVGQSESRQAEFEAFRAQRYDPANLMEPQASFMRAIRNAIPDDGIFISGMTQIGYFSRAYYPVYKPGTYITSSYSGNLGFAFPTALGAKVACPNVPVVCVSGDGGFMYNVQELATAVQYGINTITVVFNDNAYGNVLREQVRRFNDHPYGANLHNPDFVKMAESFGARGLRVHDADALETAIRESIAVDAPTLIEVPVGMMESSF